MVLLTARSITSNSEARGEEGPGIFQWCTIGTIRREMIVIIVNLILARLETRNNKKTLTVKKPGVAFFVGSGPRFFISAGSRLGQSGSQNLFVKLSVADKPRPKLIDGWTKYRQLA
jgi:hypothetical protein